MTRLEELLDYNRKFVEERKYESFRTSKYPKKNMVILTCMDTRLTELLPKAMNIGQGDAKIVKNAGAIVHHPFGSAMRSIVVAVHSLHAEEIFVVGHHDCGNTGLNGISLLEKAVEHEVSVEKIKVLHQAGINVQDWLTGISDVYVGIRQSVEIIKHHPLIPESTPVHGLIIDPVTGKLEVVINGNEKVGTF